MIGKEVARGLDFGRLLSERVFIMKTRLAIFLLTPVMASLLVAQESETPATETSSEVALEPPAAPVIPDAQEVAAEATEENSEDTEAGTEGAPIVYDLTLKDGRVLKNYQVHSWSKTSLTIFHDTGAMTVPAHLLPDDLVEVYSMDTELSQKEQSARKAKRTKEAEEHLLVLEERKALRSAPSVIVDGQVMSVSDRGMLIKVAEPLEVVGHSSYQRVGGIIVDRDGRPVPKFKGRIFGEVWITEHPQQASVVDGDRLQFRARVVGRHQIAEKTHRSLKYEGKTR